MTIQAIPQVSPIQPATGERFADLARALASSDQILPGIHPGKPLLPRLVKNGQILAEIRRQFEAAARARQATPPAAEWLLDNYYIVEQHLYQARQDLSPAFYDELPKLANNPLAGFPRVYNIAIELITHTDSRLTEAALVRFVNAYQEHAPLSTGEVWAIAIMLRIALIEHLRRLMERAFQEFETQQTANARAEALLAASNDPDGEFLTALKRLAEDPALRDPTFLVQLVLRLRDQDPAVAPALHVLEEHMGQTQTMLEELIRAENQRRAISRVSTGNVIGSLRFVAALDWHVFFEDVSLIERALNHDPDGTYPEMDFRTRDRYRHVVETIAQHDPAQEINVAQHAVELAQTAARTAGTLERTRHVGYFLIDEGLPILERDLQYRPPFRERARRLMLRNATLLYLAWTALLAMLFVGGAVWYAAGTGASAGMLALVALLALLPFSLVASGILNWTLSVLVKPNTPPKLELEEGIPPHCRTMVVIPALIANISGLEYLVEHLELCLLANRDANLHFAILGDFGDAPQEHMPEDEELLAVAASKIQELNEKYERADAFFLLHRRRQWNPGEKSWMGWERKRGKLEEFNRLLRGEATSYVTQTGDLGILPQIKYVITLDADTELPLQVARRLVGTIAHPLNRAVLDPVSQTVVKGYGIIQPRVDIVAPAALRSRFARLFAGDTGLDPYASIVSDVYQDFIGRAVYIGKAIYHVDTLRDALSGRFPENLLLSHDLLEGGFVRVGYASDIELLEDFPSGYDAYAQRNHRWVRGDWQITDWLFPRVRGTDGKWRRNPLPVIERWKIMDNLRRSLISPLVILWLLAAWTVLPGSRVGWTILALLTIMFPFVRASLTALGGRPDTETLPSYLWAVAQELWTSARRGMVTIIFLLYQATLNLDAILRSLVRRTITHSLLLEWTSQAVAERGQARTVVDYVRRMWFASALALGIAALLAWMDPSAFMVALPLLLLWFLAPSIAHSISQPFQPTPKPLSATERNTLRATARRIWRFYETFAGEMDHWLPPDNYQVTPESRVAHRTSPTNIGFLLLSIAAAYDFGYIEPAEFAERVERVLDTLDQMETRRGHFYNWYDTTTLKPMHPHYISTVDSGNLMASLVILKQVCLEMTATPRSREQTWQGLADTLFVLEQTLGRADNVAAKSLREEVERLRALLESRTQSSPETSVSESLSFSQFETRALYLSRLANRLDPRGAQTLEIRDWCEALLGQVKRAQQTMPTDLGERLGALARRADTYAAGMEFEFLFDPVRGVFTIGYNADTHRRDESYYDLLASEARITSFMTIARGDIPVKHWFRLSRPLIRLGGKVALLSWSGTMFEYLMPPLFMLDYKPSLLQQTELAVIQEQIAYASRQNMPWGISESGFYSFDYHFNYQYRAFGVPELSLRHEVGPTRVIAPYATFLALPHAPHAAVNNLKTIRAMGGVGVYGYFEALDLTPEHLPQGKRAAIVESYMAHHQGMSLMALDNYFYNNAMPRRFHAEPANAAAELLLQERVPRHTPFLQASKQAKPLLRIPEETRGPSIREFSTPHTFTPRAHILSNGKFSVMLTNAGGGYSAWGDNQVTRWREDATFDALGSFCFIQDVESSRVWSNTFQPTCAASEQYHVVFSGNKVRYLRRDTGIETVTEITVAADNNAEIRRITLDNPSAHGRTLELTTYAEIVLDNPRSDAAHPAFSKLFVESEFVPAQNALLFKRRPRDADQPERWAVHFLCSDSQNISVREHETDRAAFIGRGRTLADPAAMHGPLTNTIGATLDPIMSLRTRVRLAPNSTVTLAFITGTADSREAALAICDDYLDGRDLAKAENLSQEAGRMNLDHLGITPADATVFQRFASRVLFPDPQLRAASETIARNTLGQEGLWASGISGDYPIVLVRVTRGDGLDLVRQVLLAHEYWRLRNFRVDVVLLDESATYYEAETNHSIMTLIETSLSHPWLDKPGGIFVRRRDLIAPENYLLLETVARVILRSEVGDLADQLNLSARHVPAVGARARRRTPTPIPEPPASEGTDSFKNGVGEFSSDDKEYLVRLADGKVTPLPWSNVIANPGFGCLVTESGFGMTWAVNSQQNKLTQWSNDPVCDPPAEIIYLQDRDTEEVWSATPQPIRREETYVTRHGAGYSVFEHASNNLEQSLCVFVPADDPVKIMQLSLRNRSDRTCRLRATYYAEWVLGAQREQTQHYIVTEQDATTGAVMARNVYSEDYTTRVAFATADLPLAGMTASRAEFLGRNGTYALPAALATNAKRLTERTGANLDPCAALQVEIELKPNEERQIVFLLGQGEHRTHARALIQKYRDPAAIAHAFDEVKARWDELLGTIEIKTPDPAMDRMVNRWLLYQTLSCRLWGRAAFYQAGGAFGFRDQLQDVLALVFGASQLARAQILNAAAHQFAEGDVQHWWHPPSDKGVRTRISDDFIWLPYATAHYIAATGDTEILQTQVPFIVMPLLAPDQEEIYGKPGVSTETASLYEHCVRALEHGLRFGVHGLPLMGTGDWNDGMNRVGVHGHGESVWLGWFLYENLIRFAELCAERRDTEHAAKFRDHARALENALQEHGWDGAWYRRAYFDDGTPLGSSQNAEARIDAIAQAWATISGAAPRDRQEQALRAVDEQLVDTQDRIIRLLTPPFVNSHPNPGYIQGYVSGIRENGGQYTHGALWVVLAQALQGNGTRAHELFEMLDPITHGRTPQEMEQYKVEPYVIAADVYAHPQHRGRGGWTWYTGSAGWMYRIAVESLLGLQLRGEHFTLAPCIPSTWTNYEIVYRVGATRYEITVENPHSVETGVERTELDGKGLDTHLVPRVDDGKTHRVRVVMGGAPPAEAEDKITYAPKE
ncbi:MAG: DUF3131 domain-containing protein [Anaerolineae bacterium]|nr:DUF3131 domain-containing protein [Anaerolineae bacterium]